MFVWNLRASACKGLGGGGGGGHIEEHDSNIVWQTQLFHWGLEALPDDVVCQRYTDPIWTPPPLSNIHLDYVSEYDWALCRHGEGEEEKGRWERRRRWVILMWLYNAVDEV